MRSRGWDSHFRSYLYIGFPMMQLLQCGKPSQNKGTAASINANVIFFLVFIFFKWHSSTNVLLLMKADFSEVPEGDAWHRSLLHIQISAIVCDVINPYCGVWWQIVSANYQITQENICGYNKRNIILVVPFRNYLFIHTKLCCKTCSYPVNVHSDLCTKRYIAILSETTLKSAALKKTYRIFGAMILIEHESANNRSVILR